MTIRSFPLLFALSVLPAAADPTPMPITSDTAEYCALLGREVASRHGHSIDADRLLKEGRRMCDHGEIRSGIARLRRALLVLKHRSS